MIVKERILNALHDCCFEDLCEGNCFENVIQKMDTSVLPRDYRTGATKLVIILHDEDYVIKIPFHGGSWGADSKYYDFENAPEPDRWDYCKVETLQYERIAEAGLQTFFVETKLLGYIKGYPVYIQPKVNIFNDVRDDDDYDEKTISTTVDICNKLQVGCFNSYWLTDFLDFFTQSDLERLSKHIRDNAIGDLHGDNLGFLSNGQPVIVDYADYWE